MTAPATSGQPLEITGEYLRAHRRRHADTGIGGKLQIALIESAIELGRITVLPDVEVTVDE